MSSGCASVGGPRRGRTLDVRIPQAGRHACAPRLVGSLADFANVWQAADKAVYSTTLDVVSTANTRLERTFDPASVLDMKASATSDLTVGGAHLAAHALEARLVDECHLLIRPVLVGRGKPALASDTRADLELLEDRRFDTASRPERHGHQAR